MRRGWLAALAATAFLHAGPGAAEDGEAAVERGRQIAGEHCVRCHAIGRDDVGKLAEAPPFRTLGQSYPVESLAEALAEGIVTGHDEMPELRLEPDDVSAFVAYLGSIQVGLGD